MDQEGNARQTAWFWVLLARVRGQWFQLYRWCDREVSRNFVARGRQAGWGALVLTAEVLEFASLNRFEGTVAELVGKALDPAAPMVDLAGLRSIWDGLLIVKSIQVVPGARAMIHAGADAVIVSNRRGGRLDRAPTPLEVLSGLRAPLRSRA